MNNWDRQPKESAQAYAAFEVYRDMGMGRTLERVRMHFGKKSERQYEEWSSQHAWVERCVAYDAHLDRIAQEAREKATAAEAAKWARRREKQREREWQLAEQLAKKAEAMLEFPVSRKTIEKDGKTYIFEPADWNFAAAARIVDTQAKLARLASEMETERTSVNVRIDWTKVPDDVVDAFADGKLSLDDVAHSLQSRD